MFVDAFNFRHAESECENGVCFLLGPTHEQLQKFYEDLQSEYGAFREENAAGIEFYARAQV